MYPATTLLRAAIFVLCAAVGLEWLLPGTLPFVPTVGQHHLAKMVQPPVSPGVSAVQHAATILARPLFSISRRPPAAKIGSAPLLEDLPRLSGIMISGIQKHAIFEGSGKPKVSAIGDQVGDYRILAITPSAVTVDGPHGTELVSLSFNSGKRTLLTPAFSGPGVLNEFRLQHPVNVPVPQPPTLEQMLAHLPQAGK